MEDGKRKEMEALIKEINYHNYNYYSLDNPTISDAEWDKLYDRNFVLKNKVRFQSQRSSNDVYFTFCNLSVANKILCITW